MGLLLFYPIIPVVLSHYVQYLQPQISRRTRLSVNMVPSTMVEYVVQWNSYEAGWATHRHGILSPDLLGSNGLIRRADRNFK